MPDWINAVGLLLSYLPDVFFDGLKKRLVTALTSAPLSQWNLPQNPFEMFNFNVVHRCVFLHKIYLFFQNEIFETRLNNF